MVNRPVRMVGWFLGPGEGAEPCPAILHRLGINRHRGHDPAEILSHPEGKPREAESGGGPVGLRTWWRRSDVTCTFLQGAHVLDTRG